jgi:LPS export ABC transporter protein LptC
MTRVLALIVTFAAVLWLLRPFGEADQATQTTAANTPQFIAEDTRWQRFDGDGTLYFEATAETLRRYDNGRSEYDRLAVSRLGDGTAWQFSSPSGAQRSDDAPLQLHAPVDGTLRREDGSAARWTAGSVFVERDPERLFSDEPVQWRDAQTKADANGFTGDWDGQRVTLRGEVHVRYTSPND